MQQEKRNEALQQAITQIEKQYGKGTIMKLGAKTKIEQQCISTGSLSLDIALGGKGIPRGRVTEIYGMEASGKTTVCLHVAANVQREGGTAAFIDAEHALDPTYAKRIGVDLDNLLISQPDYGEQALEIAETLVRSNSVDLIVVDSVAALVPKTELEGEMGDQSIGLQARLMSSALRKLVGSIAKSNTAVIFTNQIRQKIGIMFGNPETTSGGIALKFYSSVRIELKRVTTLKEGDEPVGTRVRAIVTKNKIAPPYMKSEFDILYSSGISREGDIIDLAEANNILEKSGTWYTYKQTKLGQGRERAREFLIANKNIAKQIENDILKALEIIPTEQSQRPDKIDLKEEKQKVR